MAEYQINKTLDCSNSKTVVIIKENACLKYDQDSATILRFDHIVNILQTKGGRKLHEEERTDMGSV